MILKFFINDAEIKQFFEGCGYKCELMESGHWQSAYHGRSEWVETERLFVQVGKQTIPAEKLMEESIKARLLSTDLGSKLAVKKAVNNLKKEAKK
jgi:hypothetical protein